MGFFRRTPPVPSAVPNPPPPALDLGQALELVLVKSVESQAGLASKMTELMVGQISNLESLMAKRLGSRGGKKSAANRKRNANGQFKSRRMSDCRLCDNPTIPDPTADEIRTHINHEQPGLNYRIEDGAVHMDADAATIQTDPDGNQVVECEDCAKGIAHDHGVH